MNSYVKSYSDHVIYVSDMTIQVMDGQTGKFIENAQVVLCMNGDEIAQYADVNGEARMRFIPVGATFYFKVAADGYVENISSYEVNDGNIPFARLVRLTPQPAMELGLARPSGRIPTVSRYKPAYVDSGDSKRKIYG